ncbi:MAG: PD-(D/E)XK nuclease domain-containing protein [Lachnospiraceae bacterium]|nr:PD-(D/E)XK nuclease domain-containing protein [Lachnospiraceae bacterium]
MERKRMPMDAQKALAQINQMEYDKYFNARTPKSIRHYGIAFCRKLCRVLAE